MSQTESGSIDGFFGDLIDGGRNIFSDLLDYQISKNELKYQYAQGSDNQSYQTQQEPPETSSGFQIKPEVMILAGVGVGLLALIVALK